MGLTARPQVSWLALVWVESVTAAGAMLWTTQETEVMARPLEVKVQGSTEQEAQMKRPEEMEVGAMVVQARADVAMGALVTVVAAGAAAVTAVVGLVAVEMVVKAGAVAAMVVEGKAAEEKAAAATVAWGWAVRGWAVRGWAVWGWAVRVMAVAAVAVR